MPSTCGIMHVWVHKLQGRFCSLHPFCRNAYTTLGHGSGNDQAFITCICKVLHLQALRGTCAWDKTARRTSQSIQVEQASRACYLVGATSREPSPCRRGRPDVLGRDAMICPSKTLSFWPKLQPCRLKLMIEISRRTCRRGQMHQCRSQQVELVSGSTRTLGLSLSVPLPSSCRHQRLFCLARHIFDKHSISEIDAKLTTYMFLTGHHPCVR
ncbi:hypothetical protein BDZ85DRAFT_107059 [Elsinoe ampelina]|uniref:Uncharacterized protein n=1 Tax=Elsinoe ampelina TaxID=302913 RepID=A0A6A6GC41_9PEZI|nr:hypothetical protein BDZ85DRAFT_107059 [Elsinoe ampelina]